MCEKCFLKWKNNLKNDIQCLICNNDIAYNLKFLEEKIFFLENDAATLDSFLKEDILSDFIKKGFNFTQ